MSRSRLTELFANVGESLSHLLIGGIVDIEFFQNEGDVVSNIMDM